MNANYSLDENNKAQAATIRSDFFPNATSGEIRDSFVFSECIIRFDDDPHVLSPYIEKESTNDKTVQRLLQVKESTHKKLKELSAALGKPISCTIRSLILYWLDKINTGTPTSQSFTPSKYQTLADMLDDLEVQLFECVNTLNHLRTMVNNELHKEGSPDE